MVNGWIRQVPLWVRYTGLILFILFLFGFIISITEPAVFPTFTEGVWWAFITITTVGYGDYAPATTAGRLIAVLLVIAGTGVVSTVFFTIGSSAFWQQKMYMEGTHDYKGQDHLILVGWNARSESILSGGSGPFVLIDESASSHPAAAMPSCTFIKGKSTHRATWMKGKIDCAALVVITANQHVDEETADAQTILSLLTVRALHPTIPCVVELLTNEQVTAAKKAGATSLIKTHETVGQALLAEVRRYS